ncbi:MAG TPA: carbamoyltransferase C-terminal domain-containing protein [Pyrinomonadaceae bacterium]|nr:carbamoyltransferase C-terminal domain-containing protein [Pyrinomonadaceae bacterium]
MYILGINAYHGDAAAALIKDGRIVAAVEEERFNRVKHSAGFPVKSIEYCLSAAEIGIEEVDHVGISRDPSAHLHKKVLVAAQRAAKGIVRARATAPSNPQLRIITEEDAEKVPAIAVEPNGNGHSPGILQQVVDRLRNAARVRDLKEELARALGISKTKLRARVHNIEHHRAHLASSFFVSQFDRAALLSLDGFGDFISTMWAVGEGNSIKVLGQVEYPHSLGIVYTATTQFLGFPHYGDEGKVMGLAPYGRPRFIEAFRDIVRTEKDGQFRLNLDYFRHAAEGVDMTWNEGSPVIGKIYSEEYARAFGAPRCTHDELTDRESDLAASLQLRLEEVAFHLLNHLYRETGLSELGLAGGVAYNSVMNGKILRNTPFRRVFIQPAAGDSGTALGVCYQIWNQLLRQSRGEVMEGAYLGPQFNDEEIVSELKVSDLKFETLTDQDLTEQAARDIAGGAVVGWFQGRLEFGPRALGNRSIIVDPRCADMKDILNERIKKREPFRPFAPSILAEQVGEYFQQTHPAPTMLMVYQIKPERCAQIPAVTHIDGSGRLQTVSREVNPRYYQLIEDFYKLTGVPLVLNTSFNENEPIVCTPRDAIDCFLKTRIDVLYLGNHVVRRNLPQRHKDTEKESTDG